MVRFLSLAWLLWLGLSTAAWSQPCSGPVRLVAGLSPGGGMDAVARMLAQQAAMRLKQPVVVENRLGAGGNLAAEFVARAPRDGCTIIIRGNEHNVNAVIYSRPGYEPRDFAPILRVVAGPAVIVAASNQPFKTLGAMVDYARAHPGKLAYGTGGIGTANHVFAEVLAKAARISLLHIPYKGAAPAMADTVGGVLPLSFGSVAAALPYIQSGRLTPLAVTGPARWPTLPDVPTLAEAGYPAATMVYWMGLLAPAGTQPAAIGRLGDAFRAALQDPALKERLLAMGYQAEGGSPQDFEQFLRQDERLSRKLMQDLQLKVD